MNKFLPSKKLLVFLVFVLVVLACVFLISKYRDRKISYFTNNTPSAEETEVINQTIKNNLKEDSDGDGLKDWEETLWKTDPNNSDTDGDGTDDNTEILANRNPLQAGPNDELAKDLTQTNLPQKETVQSAEDKKLTQTDLISRELFTGYVALKQKGQLGTEQETQFINNLITKNLSLQTKTIKKYTLDDFVISPDNSQEKLQQYTDKIIAVAKLGNNLEDELILVKTALEDGNNQILKELDANIKIYQEMQKQLLALEVPSTLANIHLKVLNDINELTENVSSMLLIIEDPLGGLLGTKNYYDNTISLSEDIAIAINYLHQKNVEFNP